MPRQMGYGGEEIFRADNHLVMLGAEARRHRPRKRELVLLEVVEPHREGAQLLDAALAHRRDDESRVEASTEEDAERYVGHQHPAHRFAEVSPELLGDFLPARGPSGARFT